MADEPNTENRIPVEIEGLDLTEVSGADLLKMEPTKLESMKAALYAKGHEIMGDAGTSLNDQQIAEGRAYLRATDAVEQALTAQKEADGLRTKFSGGVATMNTPATMPGAGNAPTPEHAYKTAGEGFVKSAAYRHAQNGGDIKSAGYAMESGGSFDMAPDLRMQAKVHTAAFLPPQLRRDFYEKALLYTASASGGAFVIPEYDMEPEQAARPMLDIIDLVRVQPINTDTINWIQQDTRSSAATGVSESTTVTGTEGQKPESTLAWSRQTSTIQTIAVWIAVTTQELADAAGMQATVEDELTFDVNEELNSQLLSGSGTAPQLDGILNQSIQALTYSSATFDNRADAIYRGMVLVATANEPPPDGIVINPVNWEPIRVLKTDGSGEYILGPPTISGPTTLWGVPLVVTNNIASGTALVGAFRRGARLYMREDSTVKTGWANTDFIENRVRLLAELRAQVATRRPSAFCQVTAL